MSTAPFDSAGYSIRKWHVQVEETMANENRVPADGDPVRKIVVAATIHNPYAGRYSHDLGHLIDRSDELGAEFGRRAQAAAGDVPIESYGKGCVVGVAGEYEHGNAMLTQFAADPLREAIGGGKAWVPSTGKIGGPGTSIDIPLAFKDDVYVRSHYDTVTAQFTDAPRPDEIVVVWAFATRGRLHARLGGLSKAEALAQDATR